MSDKIVPDSCIPVVSMANACPIRERTGDGIPVGRCYYNLTKDGVCPRHGDVAKYRDRYQKTGELTDERELIIRRELGKALELPVGETPDLLVIDDPCPGVRRAEIDIKTGEARLQLEDPADFIKLTLEV